MKKSRLAILMLAFAGIMTITANTPASAAAVSSAGTAPQVVHQIPEQLVATNPIVFETTNVSTVALAYSAPLPHATVTSCFGPRWGTVHEGIDFAMPGGTPIHAAQLGTVVRTGWWSRGYGISVLIFIGGKNYMHYAHMSKSAVHVGQHVLAGQIIGYVGTTGDSTGNHLHFEIWSGWWHQIDPVFWFVIRRLPVGNCR